MQDKELDTSELDVLKKQISKMKDSEIENEFDVLDTMLFDSKYILMKLTRQMKKIKTLREMMSFLSEFSSYVDIYNTRCIYMYKLAVELVERFGDEKPLLHIGKTLKASKKVIATFEKERWSVIDPDINQMVLICFGTLVKSWHDVAHSMSDHQEIINRTIGKRKYKEKLINLSINDLLKNDEL